MSNLYIWFVWTFIHLLYFGNLFYAYCCFHFNFFLFLFLVVYLFLCVTLLCIQSDYFPQSVSQQSVCFKSICHTFLHSFVTAASTSLISPCYSCSSFSHSVWNIMCVFTLCPYSPLWSLSSFPSLQIVASQVFVY